MNTTTLADRRSLWQVLLRGLRELRWSGITVYFGFTALAAVAGGWAMSRAATATARAYAGQPLGAVPFTALGLYRECFEDRVGCLLHCCRLELPGNVLCMERPVTFE